MRRGAIFLAFGCLVVAVLFLAGCAGGNGEDVFSAAEQAFANGEYEKAIELFTEAAKLMPDNPSVYGNRANCHSYLGDLEAALTDYETAITKAAVVTGSKDDPRMALFYYNRGFAYAHAELYREAIQDYQKTIAVNPDYPDVKNNLAWILSTCAHEELRDPRRAVELAREQCEKDGWKQSGVIDTFAAALAASERFAEAVEMQRKALELAPDEATRKDFQSRLDLYEAGKPYYQEHKKG